MNDEFAKKIIELKMAVGTFVSSYQNETNAIVVNVSTMMPIIAQLEKIWIAYSNGTTNEEIQKAHVKIRARIQMLKTHINDSIRSCGSDTRLLDKYSENQHYIERKVSDLYSAIPKEIRTVKEAMQFEFDLDSISSQNPQSQKPQYSKQSASSDSFIRNINELRISISGFVSSYQSASNSIIGYIKDMELIVKTIDSLWRRSLSCNGQVLEGILSSIKKSLQTLESQCSMSELIGCSTDSEADYEQNHHYIRKKVTALIESFPKE